MKNISFQNADLKQYFSILIFLAGEKKNISESVTKNVDVLPEEE